jgi:hypothetical protein
MPRVGFESTFPVFEWVKAFLALDRAANVIGQLNLLQTSTKMHRYAGSNTWITNTNARLIRLVHT